MCPVVFGCVLVCACVTNKETERQILGRDFGWTQLISGKGEKNHIENRWRDDR